MENRSMYVGLDVHKETIDVSIAEGHRNGEVRHYGVIASDLEPLDKVVRALRAANRRLHFVYEAGPCGFGIYRHLTTHGEACVVVSPSMVPKRSGDRVKTDRRDSLTLARLHRAGELRAIYVPDDADEAMRDLVRAREDAVVAGTQAKYRLKAFLLRQGRRYPGREGWTLSYRRWLTDLSFPTAPQHITLQEYRDTVDETERRIARLTDQLRQLAATWRWAPVVAALQALRGVSFITAVAVVAELGDLTRFGHPRELMAYLGLVPSEYSSGPSACVSTGSVAQSGVRHRVEGPTPIDDALPPADRTREGQTESRHGDCARARRLHLGDRAGGFADVAVRATRAQDVVVHRSFRRYGDQVENPRKR
jgi:transposase